MNSQRILPLEPPYAAGVQADFDSIMPDGVAPLNLFRTVGHNPRALHKMMQGGLLGKGSVSVSEREIVILRTCVRCRAEYEWGVHVAIFAQTAGFNDEQVADLCNDSTDAGLWSSAQRLLIRLADELHDSSTVGDELWRLLTQHFEADQLIELIMLAGLYHSVSFLCNGLGLANEAFAPAFPRRSSGMAPGLS